MSRRSLRDRVRRRPAHRAPKRRILLFCEGKVTEPRYFEALARKYRQLLIEIEVSDDHGVPKTLVEQAAKHKKDAERNARKKADSFARFDEVWCVFDADDHPNVPDAMQQARDNDICIAFSNPCFELWALLHYQDQSAPIDRKALRRKLKQHLSGYDKQLPADEMFARLEDALKRASELYERQQRNDNLDRNPCTTVHKLVARVVTPPA